MDTPAIEPIWRYRPFQCAIGLPATLFMVLATYVCIGDGLSWAGWYGGSAALMLFWQHFKVPLAVLSLSVPLGAWAIADKRNRTTEEALLRQELALNHQRKTLAHQMRVFEAQEEKRALDLYWGKAKHIAQIMSYQTAGTIALTTEEILIAFEYLFGKGERLWPLSPSADRLKAIRTQLCRITSHTSACSDWLAQRHAEALSEQALNNHHERDELLKQLKGLKSALNKLEREVGLFHASSRPINESLDEALKTTFLLSLTDKHVGICGPNLTTGDIKAAGDSVSAFKTSINWYCEYNEINPDKNDFETLIAAVQNHGHIRRTRLDASRPVA
ncbi:hypothetical protein [Ferrimonas balearica]|uniref:hypothetical protein n=1 Tax=Ferrimonas balearica TaxID=44012 RepID=UPI001C591F75|nr:hypothetical protein [Ferrimonas balearica]MBW3163594.1 hypothetical protein [Ferrimonas balearica]